MTDHLVTDAEAEMWNALIVGRIPFSPGIPPEVTQRLLALRAACVEKLEAVSRVLDTNDDGDFWSVMNSVAPFLAQLHGDKSEAPTLETT